MDDGGRATNQRLPECKATNQQSTDTGATAMHVRLLGGFRVIIAQRPIDDGAWRLQKARALVKLLSLSPGHRLHREQVLDALWPDLEPEAATNNLHRTLHSARRTLGMHDAVRLQGGLLLLQPAGGLLVDVEEFERAARVARRENSAEAYRVAVRLYKGDLLPEDRYEDWAALRREALRETYLALLLTLANLEEKRGERAVAVAELQRLLAAEPAHEDAHVALMRLYALGGQRAQALRQWTYLREALRQSLDAEPGAESRRLYAEILAGRFPPPEAARAAAPPPAPPALGQVHSLPVPLSSFVGREEALAELAPLLATTRLLTLAGPGGVGKTRLALELARTVAADYADGATWVELGSLTDPTLVSDALATALGLQDDARHSRLEAVANALRHRTLLLVLDNCEHLVEACARAVITILGASPGLRILATSREALRVQGELAWRVPPLGLPGDDEGEVADAGAVRLFVERARFVRPGFALQAANQDAVRQICRRLDGLPLAIELASARMSALSAAQLAARLEDALGLLTLGGRSGPPRQSTLRATLDWSYRLLATPEQTLLRRLAVFADNWTLEAAEVVGADGEGWDQGIAPGAVLDLLAQLVDKSLVVVEEGGAFGGAIGAASYRLLETVRQYALGELAAAGEAEAARERHAAYCLALATEAAGGLDGPKQVEWLARLERAHGDARAALRWLADAGRFVDEAQLCVALVPFWNIHGHLAEGGRQVGETLARATAAGLPSPLRAGLLWGAGLLAGGRGEPEQAEKWLGGALALYRELGDARGIATSLLSLGVVWQARGEYEAALPLHLESMHLWEELADDVGVADSLLQLGNLARLRGEATRATEYYRRSLTLHRGVENPRGQARALGSLGIVASQAGDYASAEDYYAEALPLFQTLGDRSLYGVTLNNLAQVAFSQGNQARGTALAADLLHLARELGDPRLLALALETQARVAGLQGDAERSGHLIGVADRLRETMNLPRPPVGSFERNLASLRAGVGEGRFDAARTAGRALTLSEGLAEALALAASTGPANPPPEI